MLSMIEKIKFKVIITRTFFDNLAVERRGFFNDRLNLLK